jgi:hypothetical protein
VSLTSFANIIQTQQYSRWYNYQRLPVLGAAASIPPALMSGSEVIHQVFLSISNAWQGHSELASDHFWKARDLAIICGDNVLNVLSIGVWHCFLMNQGLSKLLNPTILPKILPGNATAKEFIDCVNTGLFTEIPTLTEKEAQAFLNRGGQLNIVTDEKIALKKIPLHSEMRVITGCNSGINRSQVAAAVMTNMGAAVRGVLAGGDSGMNPHADFPIPADPSEDIQGTATNFRAAFGHPKSPQMGVAETQTLDTDPAKAYYQQLINKLDQTHFITFSTCGVSTLRRLLAKEGSLDGFVMTYIPWGDEVAHPSGGEPFSIAAYTAFGEKVRGCFEVIPSKK